MIRFLCVLIGTKIGLFWSWLHRLMAPLIRWFYDPYNCPKARKEGFEAARAGKSIDDCPYCTDDEDTEPKSYAWRDGWREGMWLGQNQWNGPLSLALLLAFILIGCERKLTRKEAVQEIQRCKDFGYQAETTMHLMPGTFYVVECI